MAKFLPANEQADNNSFLARNDILILIHSLWLSLRMRLKMRMRLILLLAQTSYAHLPASREICVAQFFFCYLASFGFLFLFGFISFPLPCRRNLQSKFVAQVRVSYIKPQKPQGVRHFVYIKSAKWRQVLKDVDKKRERKREGGIERGECYGKWEDTRI